MAVDFLNNCSFDLEQIEKLYVGSRLTNGNQIYFPINYNTKIGSDDSIVMADFSGIASNVIIIGGQYILVNEIKNLGENITFSEKLVINNLGKVYTKELSFVLPRINVNLVQSLREYVSSKTTEYTLTPTIAFLVDENGNQLVVGYDKPLLIDEIEIGLGGDENMVMFTFKGLSHQRSRNYEKE